VWRASGRGSAANGAGALVDLELCLIQKKESKMKIWRRCIACGKYALATDLVGGMCIDCNLKLQQTIADTEKE